MYTGNWSGQKFLHVAFFPSTDGERYADVKAEGSRHQQVERLGIQDRQLNLSNFHDDERKFGKPQHSEAGQQAVGVAEIARPHISDIW